MSSALVRALIGLAVTASTASAVPPPAPDLNVGTASGAPGTTVQVPISIVRNGALVTATSNLIQYDNTKFTPGTCVAQPPFSQDPPVGNSTAAATLNGKVCTTQPAVSCTTDSECASAGKGACNVDSVVSLSLADGDSNLQPDPFVADGTFVLCPFTITVGTAPATYAFASNTASWSDATGAENPASGTVGSITVLPDADGDGVPDSIDNCPYTANPLQEDRGGRGSLSPPDGIGDACQCGDVNGDGRVTQGDSVIILRSGLTQLCDVGPAGPTVSCTQADSVIILRSLLTPPTATMLQHCAPANPAP